MMEILQSPLLIAIVGFGIAVACLWGFLQTGHKAAIIAALVIGGITTLLIVLGNYLETDKERIEAMVYATASEIEANQVAAIVARVYPSNTTLKSQVENELQRYTFSEARINTIHEIEINDVALPRTAIVKMNVTVSGEFSGFSGTVPRYLEVKLREQGDAWLVDDYFHAEPMYYHRGEGGWVQ